MNFGMFPANKPFPPPPGPAVSTLPHDAGGTLGSFRPRVSPMGSPSRLPPGYSPQMMMFGQLPFISSPYNHQTNIVASPARPPPTVFFQVSPLVNLLDAYAIIFRESSFPLISTFLLGITMLISSFCEESCFHTLFCFASLLLAKQHGIQKLKRVQDFKKVFS